MTYREANFQRAARPSFDATFCHMGMTGSFYYRGHLPAAGLGAGYVQRDGLKDESGEVVTVDIAKVRDPQDGSVVVYHMPFRDWQLEEIQQLKGMGIKVITDVDDSIWSCIKDVPSHPHLQGFKDTLDQHVKAIELCDAITVSTPHLKSEMQLRFRGKPVHLCENGMDPWRFNIRKIRDDGRFVIGWQGGIGHDEAWQQIGPQVAKFMEDHEDSVLLIVGQAPPVIPELEDNPGILERCQHVEWTTMSGYVPWVSRFTVGLAPSLDNGFYRGKSPLRLYEYQAACVPALCSGPTYDGHFVSGETALNCHNDDWYAALKELHDSPKLRHKLRQKGRRHLNACNTIEQRLPQWRAAIESVR